MFFISVRSVCLLTVLHSGEGVSVKPCSTCKVGAMEGPVPVPVPAEEAANLGESVVI